MAKPNAKAPLGQGGRFAALKNKLGQRKGVTNPGALAAYIGRQKYGAKKMASMSAAGRMQSHMPAGGKMTGNWGDIGELRQKEAAAVGGFKDGGVVSASGRLPK